MLICSGINLHAQAQRTSLFGYVEDSITGEKLINVTITASKNGSTSTVVSNNFGFFTLTLTGSQIDLTISHVGYETRKFQIDGAKKHELNIKLSPEADMEEEVIITSQESKLISGQIGKITVPGNIIKRMPKFLGDNDVLKTLQTLPGITQGVEGTSALLVRGGSPDQNLFLLDGTPIYNPTHLGGIFSPFNGDAIKDVEVYKGAFPARFGERLSSVINMATKDGNMKKLSSEGSVGMLASKVLFEGPIRKDRSSFMVSARRTYWDLLASPLIGITNSEEEKRKMGLYFYDVNVKLNHIFSHKDRIYGSFFFSNDHYKFTTITNLARDNYSDKNIAKMGWQNLAGSVRWNHLFSSKIFSNTTLYLTNYDIVTDYSNQSVENGTSNQVQAEYSSKIKDYGIKSDFEYTPNPRNQVKFGLSASYKYFQPGSSYRRTFSEGEAGLNSETSNGTHWAPEIALYAEDAISLSKKITAGVGARFSAFKAESTWYKSAEPRLMVQYKPLSNLSFSAAYSQMKQYIHLLANNSVSLPTDIWVPSTDSVRPVSAKQISFAVNTSLADNDIDIGLELYYKKMDDIVEYKDGESYFSSTVKNWYEKVARGTGKAYGVELFLQKKFGRFTGWAGYSLSWSNRHFLDINNGNTFPFKYDRRHVLNLVFMQKLSDRWRLSATWQYQSGAPFTLPTSRYKPIYEPTPYGNSNNFYEPVDYIAGRNQFRLLDYHKLDISFTWSKKKKNFEKYWDFSFYNVYNRKNPIIYYFDQGFVGSGGSGRSPSLKGKGVFPFMPSISYGFKF